MRARRHVLSSLVLAASCAACASRAPQGEGGWTSMFDGARLGAWQVSEFGGEGPVQVRDGALELEPGSPMTGVHWGGSFPRTNYEFELRATRIDGSDFFCGLTFPVGDEHLSFILGGWGGSLVGISNLDGADASENETKRILSLEDGRAYRVRVRVLASEVVVRLDGKVVVAFDPSEHELGIRPEVAPSKPLGIACFATTARLEGMRWRPLRGSRRAPALNPSGPAPFPAAR